MKSCIVEKADDGRRLDRWLSAHFPQLPGALAQKFLRVKRIRLNGKDVTAEFYAKNWW